MKKELFEQLINANLMIKDWTDIKSKLQTEVLKEMNDNEIDKVEMDKGSFSISDRDVWNYDIDTKDSIKKIQKKAQKAGSAIKKTIEVLTFRIKKDGTIPTSEGLN